MILQNRRLKRENRQREAQDQALESSKQVVARGLESRRHLASQTQMDKLGFWNRSCLCGVECRVTKS